MNSNTLRPFPPLTKGLLAMLGPSVVFVALSINGGEMLLWPSLVANFGLNILWPVPIILALQFLVNIEIERYTLVTGKHVAQSLTQGSRWLAAVFGLTALSAQIWPAWMTTAGNLIAVLFGISAQHERTVGLIIACVLLLCSLFLFSRKKIYQALEKIARVGLSAALLIIVLVVVIKFDWHLFTKGLGGFFQFGYIPSTIPRFDFVAALAYGGVAGILNLVQSEWIKDKGYGVNELTNISNVEITSPAAQHNFKQWFRAINKEHAILFLGANVVTIFLLAYLGSLLLPLGTAQGFGVLKAEIRALNQSIPFLGILFGASATMLFIMANLVILDATGRLLKYILEPVAQINTYVAKITSNSGTISSIAAILGIGILCLSLFFPSFKQPFFLLVTSACLGAFTMWLYPPLLLQLNYQLPAVAKPRIWRSIGVVLCSLVYGFATVWALSTYIPAWLLWLLGIAMISYHGHILFKFLLKK